MNIRTTIVLLVVLAALSAYVLLSGNNTDEADPTAIDPAMPILDAPASDSVAVLALNPADIQAIEVQSTTGLTVSLGLDANGWNITGPFTAPADHATVTRVVTDLAQLSATRIITPTGQDLAAYGLDNPRDTITLLGAEGVLAHLHLGVTNPTGSATYIRRDDTPTIYLVNNFEIEGARAWGMQPPLQPTPMPTLPPIDAPTAPPPAPTP